MDTATHAALGPWVNFYLVTGTAAAALTGLQFVVQTLLSSNAFRPVIGADPEAGIAAFGTPTVVHFTVSLILSAALCAPWPDFTWLRAMLVVLGAVTLAYSGIVLRRTRRQESYQTTLYDWMWHVILPGSSYGGVLLSALLLGTGAEGPLFGIATATLVLLCVGIHNAWDTVTYLSISLLRRERQTENPLPPRQSPRKHQRKR